jgi:hypothetical protein
MITPIHLTHAVAVDGPPNGVNDQDLTRNDIPPDDSPERRLLWEELVKLKTRARISRSNVYTTIHILVVDYRPSIWRVIGWLLGDGALTPTTETFVYHAAAFINGMAHWREATS